MGDIMPPPRKDSVVQSQGTRRRPTLEVHTAASRGEAQPWEFTTATSSSQSHYQSSSQSFARQDYRTHQQQPPLEGMSSAPVLTQSRQDLSPYDDMIQNLDAMVTTSFSRKGSASMPASQPQSQRSPLDFGSLEASLDSMIKSNDSVGGNAPRGSGGPLLSPLSDLNISNAVHGNDQPSQQSTRWNEDQGSAEVLFLPSILDCISLNR
jgi:hypothetical protein